MSKGKIIVIVAPSGAGKTTLIQRLKKDFPDLNESVSHTTRPKRPGDVNGKSYFFIDEEEFKTMVENDAFIEWAHVHGNFYGTSKNFLMTSMNNGDDVLCDIDVQGADNIKKLFPLESVAIFIAPPTIEILQRRLENRGTEDADVIAVRVNNAKRELLRKDDFDFCVVNDELEKAYRDLKKIFEQILKRDH